MFVRIKKNSGTFRQSVLVCHNVRHRENIYQFTAKVLGHSDQDTDLELLKIKANEWIKTHGKQWLQQNLPNKRRKKMISSVSVFNLREEARINSGVEDIFGKLYQDFGFQTLLSPSHQKTLRKVIFARILTPGSKRRLSLVAEKDLAEELPLDRIYRMMDSLIKHSDEVQQKIFSVTETALQGKISLLLFDVTTLSFETVEEDELRAFGYSKDCRFNTTQIVLALATTQEGLPIGFKLFPGNTAETKTLMESINCWKQHIPIADVTVIGDRAMMSEANLEQLEAAGFQYIVAFPLRKLPKVQQEFILNKSNYKNITDNEISSYCPIELGNRFLCVSYNEKRALKDQKDRERMVKKLQKKLALCKNVKRLVNNNGYLKYTEITGNASASIDEDKIAKDTRWDGLHGVISNRKFNELEAYDNYRRLWIIEESFRINKHNLKMRPIYHFTPRRIQAHVLLCYMEFALMRYIQFKLKMLNQSMSIERIVNAVKDVQASILVDVTNDRRYREPSSLTDDARVIYESFGLERKLLTSSYP